MATKEQVIFWLKRRIHELEAAPRSVKEMAEAGTPYSSRRRELEHADKQAEQNAGELAAMRQALNIIYAAPASSFEPSPTGAPGRG